MRAFRHRRWHPDEVFVKINGVKHDLWRAVYHEGEVLENFEPKRRDKRAARIAAPRLSPSGVSSARPDHCQGRGLSEAFLVCLVAPQEKA
jgi:hypothetical protein